MKISESAVQKSIQQYADANPKIRLWRNNTGAYKIGSRFVRFGLCKGSSDLIGYTEVKITPGMVGKTVAVFMAVEVKKPGGVSTDLQDDFVDTVASSGGVGMIADSVDVVVARITGYLSKMKRKVK
jgi:hypothetical protein